jgi:hypothetical protein
MNVRNDNNKKQKKPNDRTKKPRKIKDSSGRLMVEETTLEDRRKINS